MSSPISGSLHTSRARHIRETGNKLDECIRTSNQIIALLQERQGFPSPNSRRVSSSHSQPNKSAFSRYRPPELIVPQVSRVRWGTRIMHSPSGKSTEQPLSPMPSSPFLLQKKEPKKRHLSSLDFFKSLSSNG